MQRPCVPPDHQTFDLLVCGGGIYGAWTAYDAVLRGLKVIIVDQGDWASGTSSASSKLVHGGLRYLETFDFGLVKKSLMERHRLIDNIPYRVWPLRFGVPVNQNSRVGSLRLKMGLLLYDFLAGTYHSKQTHLHFNTKAFLSRFPKLKNNRLKCGYTYLDAQTDDARLVLEIIDGACKAGATCLNYCQVTEILEDNGVINGAVLHDKVSAIEFTIKTSAIVNAVGQWASLSFPVNKCCRLSKGVHLVLPRVLDQEALLLTAKSDGRVFFIIPWYGLTLLGTTDTDFRGDIDDVTVDKQDIDYLLSEANLALSTQWTEKDIQGQYAGLRVLKQSSKNSPSDVTRDWELKSIGQGLFYSIGGKLTSSREDAAHIVDLLGEYLGKEMPCKTYNVPLPWLPEQNFIEWTRLMTEKGESLGIDSESIVWLLRRQGKRVADIFLDIEKHRHLADRITATVPLIEADLMFCLKHEMVIHLEDLLRRRIPLLILYRMTEAELRKFADACAVTLQWDQETIEKEIQVCTQKWLMH